MEFGTLSPRGNHLGSFETLIVVHAYMREIETLDIGK